MHPGVKRCSLFRIRRSLLCTLFLLRLLFFFCIRLFWGGFFRASVPVNTASLMFLPAGFHTPRPIISRFILHSCLFALGVLFVCFSFFSFLQPRLLKLLEELSAPSARISKQSSGMANDGMLNRRRSCRRVPLPRWLCFANRAVTQRRGVCPMESPQ